MENQRKQLLKMIEEGRISAEEAFKLLEAMEREEKEAKQKEEKAVEVSPFLDEKAFQKEEPPRERDLKKKVFSFLDQTVKKIKDTDLDFNFGTSYDVNQIFQHSDVEVSSLDLDIANGNVTIEPWSQNEVRIECSAKVYKVNSQEEAKKLFSQETIFSTEEGKIRFNVQNKGIKVKAHLFIPNVEYNEIILRTFNGPIVGKDLKIGNLKAKTANGSLSFENIRGEKGEFETVHGALSLQNISLNKCEGETINGAINLRGEARHVDLQTFNGSIEQYLIQPSQYVFLKSTAGSIKTFFAPGAFIDGSIRSNFGNLTCNLPNVHILEEKNEKIQKVLKFRSINSGESVTKIVAESRTGAIGLYEREV
ncbi:DUF4097 family beta strand repeat-containing protein [Priestia endophytica]|uniref:DUF4097 family beta strand repeat-containing protein n=1 Tax=Priestia endophytica TaxID=135735 RepID=UPI000F5212C3|nr:DUF4097 domain-containing protein [Priestia endophytica]MED4071312.1 DUF4097 domain-containing protein [Priestia endophytica]RPK08857.1 hypothetical protein FH5_04658 [Priestia endophytica]